MEQRIISEEEAEWNESIAGLPSVNDKGTKLEDFQLNEMWFDARDGKPWSYERKKAFYEAEEAAEEAAEEEARVKLEQSRKKQELLNKSGNNLRNSNQTSKSSSSTSSVKTDVKAPITSTSTSNAPSKSLSPLLPPLLPPSKTISNSTPILIQPPSISTSGPLITSRLPSTKSRKLDVITIEDSSEDSSEDEVIEKRTSKKSRLSTTTTSTSRTSTSSKKVSKVKPRPSLEKATEIANKLKIPEFTALYPTIKHYVNFLHSHQSERKKQITPLFAHYRICFVNQASDPKNKMDQNLKVFMNTVNKFSDGKTLVAPEDFIPSPPNYKEIKDWEELAIKERWTTHIIPQQTPSNYRFPPPFNSILPCFGIERDLNGNFDQDEIDFVLGDFVKVVRYQWAEDSVKDSNLDTRSYELSGDLRSSRKPKESQRKEDEARERRREEDKREKAREERSKGKRKEGSADTTDDDEIDGDEIENEPGKNRSVSPFGSDDYPSGEERNRSIFPKTITTSINSPSKTGTEAEFRSKIMKDFDFDPDLELDCLSDSDEEVKPEPQTYLQLQILEDVMDDNSKSNGASSIRKKNLDTSADSIEVDSESEGEMIIDESPKDSNYIFSTKGNDDETDEEREEFEREDEEKKRNRKNGGMEVDDDDNLFEPRKRYQRKYACDMESTGGSRGSGPNEETAQIFDSLAKLVKGQQWRVRGYRMAAGILRNQEKKIKTYDEARKLRGIGDSIATKLVEIVKSGTLRRLEATLPKTITIDLFSKIYGVGAAHASNFYAKGARTLEDLHSTPGIELTMNQKLGLEYFDDLNLRIPRAEVEKLYDFAVLAAKEIDPKLQVHCMGSFRREEIDCGDIDLMVTRDPSDGTDHFGLIEKLWDRMMEKDSILTHLLVQPEESWKALDAKFNGLCQLPNGKEGEFKIRRIDIFGVPFDELPAALIAYTGNEFFNRSIRLKARHMGYRLNQKSLYVNVLRGKNGEKLTEGTRVACKTEEDIFKKLHVPYRPPHQRIP